jgi:predicted RNase H-like HicB family nuclease
MRQYIGLIRKETDSDYGVSFPDFPGVVTAGTTLDEARALAEEALALHIEGLVEDREAIPEPSSLDHIMADPENRDGVAILVAVKTEAAKSIRVNVTLPEDVLDKIDRWAVRQGLTRSAFLARAAKHEMDLTRVKKQLRAAKHEMHSTRVKKAARVTKRELANA